MMPTYSIFKNGVPDGNVFIGVSRAPGTVAIESSRATKGALLVLLLGVITAAAAVIFIQLLNIMHFFLVGSTWTRSELGLLIFVTTVTASFAYASTVHFGFWFASEGLFIEDDDDEENPHVKDISDALSELFCLGFITGYLASAALVDRYPNVLCNVFGLGSDSVDMFNILMVIPVMLLWMFLTTMRVYHAAVKRAEKAKGGSKVEHADRCQARSQARLLSFVSLRDAR